MASSFDSTLAGLGINTTSTQSAANSATSTAPALDQSDFLKLMTAQLQNQDPFNPVDNTQMVAQLAQFSSVAGIGEINSTLKAIADKLTGTSPSEALSYVGHNVLTEGSDAYGRTDGGLSGAVELDGAATNVDVTISDQSGNVLRTLSLGPQAQGTVNYDWDGVTSAGEDAGSGPFHVTVAAHDGASTVASRGLVWAPVTSVSLPSTGSPVLSVAGIGPVSPSAIRQVG